MKHIFSIHSPITYFCAANVVTHENLKKEEVIFLYSNFKPPCNLGTPVPSFYAKHSSLFRKIRTFNTVKAFDTYINQLTGYQEFIAYIDLAHYYQKILITNSYCKKFHFIEEGTASYIPPRNLNDLTRIESTTGFRLIGLKEKIRAVLRILRGYNLKLLALPYFANAYTFLEKSKFYGFDTSVYPGVSPQKKVIMKPKSVDFINSRESNDSDISNSLILIEESYFRVYGISKRSARDCLENTLLSLKNDIGKRKVLIKLRPSQKKEEALWIPNLERHGISYDVIPQEAILEALLMNSKNCKVIGTISSLLFYAAIFGHSSSSNYSLIEDKPISVFDEFDFYWKKVLSIDLHS